MLGFFYLRAAGLTSERRERVLAILPDERMPYRAIKDICLRIFPEIHTNEKNDTHRRGREANVAQARSDAQSSSSRATTFQAWSRDDIDEPAPEE